MSDPPPPKCPECGGKIVLQLSRSAVRFKGSGWYATDYAPKSSSDEPKPAAKTTESKTDSKAESKTESKTESKSEAKTVSKSDRSGSKEKK
jgi:predicted nucleic acid-binding Zn ribbon protein